MIIPGQHVNPKQCPDRGQWRRYSRLVATVRNNEHEQQEHVKEYVVMYFKVKFYKSDQGDQVVEFHRLFGPSLLSTRGVQQCPQRTTRTRENRAVAEGSKHVTILSEAARP